MSINCSIIRDPNDPSKILFTEAPNGARSLLFDDLRSKAWDQERALDMWLTSKTTTFRQSVTTPKLNKHRIQLQSKIGNITPNVDTLIAVNEEGGRLTLDMQNMDFRVDPTPNVKPLVQPRVPVLSIEEQKALVKLERDSEGNILADNGNISNLSEDHARLVRTPAFKQWFGDWQNNPQEASQVVDENGEPKVFLHGSPVPNLTKFDRSQSGKSSSLKEFGTYFTDNERVARVYSRSPRKPELEADLRKKRDNLYEAQKQVRSSREWEQIQQEIEKIDQGQVYEVFLNVKPQDVHTFDAQGKGGVRAYDLLKVETNIVELSRTGPARYKAATNRDAMEFLKEGGWGVTPKKAINATNVAEVDDIFYDRMDPIEQREWQGETYLILDGNEDAIRMATDTEFGLAQQQVVPRGPSTSYTMNAYAFAEEQSMGVSVGRIRFITNGNEIMIDNSTLRNLQLEDQSAAPANIAIDVEGIRMQDRAGSKISKGLAVTNRKADATEDNPKGTKYTEVPDVTMEYVREFAEDVWVKNANKIRLYPQVRGRKYFKPIKTAKQADAVYETFVEAMKDNLVWLSDQLRPEFREPASLWYDGANKMANDMATKYNTTPEQVAGMIAAMSPQKDWYQNVKLADLTLQAFEADPVLDDSMILAFDQYTQRAIDNTSDKTEKQKKIDETAKDREFLLTFMGQKLSEVPNGVASYMIRMFEERIGDKTYHALRPDGEKMDLVRRKDKKPRHFAWGSYTEIGKAVSIYRNGSTSNISLELGTEHKIRNFYNNIIDPNALDGDVTIDTHAVAAATLIPTGASHPLVAQNFGTKNISNSGAAGVSGIYYAYAEAYNRAAKELGLLPRQVQSITWEAARGLFPDALKKNKKTKRAIDNIWEEYKSGKININEARNRIFEESNGIDHPTWARFALPVSEDEGRQGPDQGGVSQVDGGLDGGATVGGAPGDGGQSVQLGRLKGKGIGAAMYAGLFKWAMKQGYNVVSSDNLSPDAERMWQKLEKMGVAKNLGDRYMLDMYPPGFDTNGEPSAEMVMDFTDRAAYERELTEEEESELYDIMMGLPVNNSEELLTTLKRAFMPDGRFKPTRESLMYSGLYTSENISDIMSNEELQEGIREFIYKLEKLDKVYLNDMYTDENYSVVEDGSRTPIGTFKLMNPFLVEQQVIQKLGGFENREDFEEALYTDDIQELIGSAYEAWKNTGNDIFLKMRKFKPTGDVRIEEGQLVPKTTGIKETLQSVMLEPISRQLEVDSDMLIGLDEEQWYTSTKSVDKLLGNVESRLRSLGMDIEGLPQMSKVNGVEATKDFLQAVYDYSINPSDQTLDALADAYHEFYEIRDNFSYTKKDIGTDTKAGNVFSLTSEQSSVELFVNHNMIPIRKGVFKRVDPVGVDALLDMMYERLYESGGYGGILPDAALKPAAADENGQLNMAKIQDRNNRQNIINSMKAWVQSEVGKLYTENINATAEELQSYILMFHFYNQSDAYNQFDTAPKMSDEFRLISQPVTNVEYLIKEFPAEMNIKAIAEKKKNSREWKDFYSNLVFTRDGIELKSNDPISRRKMLPYLNQNPDLVNYFRIHKEKPELDPQVIEDPIIDDLFRRNYYTNYPTALKPFRGEYTQISGNTITASSKAPFLRTQDGVYEMVEAIGRFGVYVKHKTNPGPLKRYNPTMSPPKMDADRKKLLSIDATIPNVTQIKQLYEELNEGFDIDEKFEC